MASIPAGARLWVANDAACAGGGLAAGGLEVVLPDGWLAPLATQPPMRVCQVAAHPTARGVWWVGGQTQRGPAVAASADAGRTWQVTELPAAGSGGAAWAQVSTLGGDVFAAVVRAGSGGPPPQALMIEAIYWSRHGGAFHPWAGAAGATVLGDVVPTLDGRLVAAGPGWQVSAGPGQGFANDAGSMPWVTRLARTPGAWVAYDLFGEDWAAISFDATTWQKINIR